MSIPLELYNLPKSYSGISYSDTKLSKVMQKNIEEKVARAPNKGTLTIHGTAAPVVNQLISAGRKVRGIDFLERSADAFTMHHNPESNIVVLYNVGTEVSLNTKVGGMVLKSIIKHYAERNTLLIIETDLTKTDLLSRYDFHVTNAFKIPPKEEELWA